MDMNLTRDGVLHLNIFDVETQEERDQFLYYYLGLSRNVRKKIENAYYAAYVKKLLPEPKENLLHTDVDGVTHIQVHPEDVIANLKLIKQIISSEHE